MPYVMEPTAMPVRVPPPALVTTTRSVETDGALTKASTDTAVWDSAILGRLGSVHDAAQHAAIAKTTRRPGARHCGLRSRTWQYRQSAHVRVRLEPDSAR